MKDKKKKEVCQTVHVAHHHREVKRRQRGIHEWDQVGHFTFGLSSLSQWTPCLV